MKDLISIIIPTYNRANTLTRSIQSALLQTYKNFELIVVNDSSTDDTQNLLKEFTDTRVRLINNSKRQGAARSRNIGIQYARGEFIAFLDSDDEWLPDKLELQMHRFINLPTNVGVVYSKFWKIQGNKKLILPSGNIYKLEGRIHNQLLNRNFVSLSTAVVRKECFKQGNYFDEKLPRFQDWDLFIQISKSYEFRIVNKPLLYAYIQFDSISASADYLSKAMILLLKKHHDDFENSGKDILAEKYYWTGSLLSKQGELKNGRKLILKAIHTYPFCFKYYSIFLLSFFGAKFLRFSEKLKNNLNF